MRVQDRPDKRRWAWVEWAARPPVLVTLLLLAFGAGLLAASSIPSRLSAPPVPLVAASPTPLPPTPTLGPTPTATSIEAGELETLYIDVAPRDMARIAARREEALELGILLASNADFVPATIRLGQDVHTVELRLKGDWIDHFATDKWSFRVRTTDGSALFGMATFSIQDPSTRGFIDEWAFLEHLRREGVLAVRYHFVHVVLNGEYKGIYALEEAFARELFEFQERREGLILRYDEDLLWEYRAYTDHQLVPSALDRFYILDSFQSGRIGRNPLLSTQRDAAFGLLRGMWSGDLHAGEVFDLETMGTFLALADLWNARHALIWHNLRYYYNPITARIEPVVFDTHPLPDYLDPAEVGLPPHTFLSQPQLQAAYVRALARVAQTGYVDQVEAALAPQFDEYRAALLPEFDADDLQPPWETLRSRQALLRQVLSPYQAAYAYVWRPQPDPDGAVDLDVGNLLDMPLEVVGLAVNGALTPARAEWAVGDAAAVVPPSATDGALVLRALPDDADSMAYIHLRVPRAELPLDDAVELPRFHLITRLWGLTDTLTQTVLPGYPLPVAEGPRPAQPSIDEALARHPYLERVDGERALRIPPGTWEIDGNLLLPAGWALYLGPGTTLRFGPDNYLLATGPLDFRGSEDEPIVLQPIADIWRGVVVLQAGAPSVWEHVTVERAAAIEEGGWILTGGITFYESPIRLDRCRIHDSQAEDGINVVRSTFHFVDSEFGPTISDAFDGDFAQGTVERCRFYDVGGDGIDVSGSDVVVRDVWMVNVDDKAISVGEGSRLAAYDVTFHSVDFGVASKDLSHTVVVGAVMTDVRIAALAAFIKKPTYGPASIDASGITLIDTPPERMTLVQTGCWIDLDGERIYGVDVDVDALYSDDAP